MEDKLSHRHQVVLILRLTLDKQGRMVYGEAVDVEGKLIGHYIDWDSLIYLVQIWVANLQEDSQFNSLL